MGSETEIPDAAFSSEWVADVIKECTYIECSSEKKKLFE